MGTSAGDRRTGIKPVSNHRLYKYRPLWHPGSEPRRDGGRPGLIRPVPQSLPFLALRALNSPPIQPSPATSVRTLSISHTPLLAPTEFSGFPNRRLLRRPDSLQAACQTARLRELLSTLLALASCWAQSVYDWHVYHSCSFNVNTAPCSRPVRSQL